MPRSTAQSLHEPNTHSQAGLYEKWVADTIAETKERSKKKRKENEQESEETVESEEQGSPKALTMVHMQGAFYILIFGVTLSAVALVGESVIVIFSYRPETLEIASKEIPYPKDHTRTQNLNEAYFKDS